MSAIFTQLGIQLKCDLRDKGILVVYYIVPLLMFFVLGIIMDAMAAGNSDYMLEAVCCIFAISMAAFMGLPQGIVSARATGVLDAYKAAGIPPWSFLLSNILLAFAHMMLVCLIIVLLAPPIFGTAGIADAPLFWGAVALAALSSCAAGTLLASLVRKQSVITMVGILVFLPSIMFTGIMFPSALLPEAMRSIGGVLPAALAQNMITGDSPQLCALAMACIALGAFLLASLLFRRAGRNR